MEVIIIKSDGVQQDVPTVHRRPRCDCGKVLKRVYTYTAVTKDKKAHWTSVGWHCGDCDRLYTNAER